MGLPIHKRFPVAVEELYVGKLRTISQEAVDLFRTHFGCNVLWDSNPDMSCLNLKLRLAVKFSHSGEVAMSGKSAGRAPSLCVKPWHLPYNWGKKHGKLNL
jgi:hypothetical protein